MTVAELIEELKKHDASRLVVLQKDTEGNGCSSILTIETGAYSKGEFGLESLTENDRKQGYTEDDVIKGIPALAFYPQ